MDMTDEQLLRYSRHILLTEIGIEGQQRLLESRVVLIGAGGLGSAVAIYLAAAGIGQITICDGDRVDLTNLQRQIVHRTESVGMPKALSARSTLNAINPDVRIAALVERVEPERLSELVRNANVVLDATDNFATRHAINRACVAHRKPLVFGAAVRFDGQAAVFDPRLDDSPCYACLFPDAGEDTDMPCSVMGVFAPLTGIIGTIQAAEAIKLLIGTGETLVGRLLLVNALDMQVRTVRVRRDPACSVCAAR